MTVEDIHAWDEGYGPESFEPPQDLKNVWGKNKKEKKRSVRSVVKGILKKGKKAIGTKERSPKKSKKDSKVRYTYTLYYKSCNIVAMYSS